MANDSKISDKDKLSKKIDFAFGKLKNEIMYFHDKDLQFAEDLTDWLLEVGVKNKIIHLFKNNNGKADKEMSRRRRQSVYWIDFGVNIGSEFNYPHFAVVIKEFTYHAIVVPITSVKEDDKDWKSEENLFVEIGKISGLPGKQEDSYALVGQIRSVSKQRLSDYRHEGSFIKLKLDNDQMDKIDNAIATLCTKEKKKDLITE